MQHPADPSGPASSAIGVDIGGTTTKLVLVDEHGKVLRRCSTSTPPATEPEPMVERLVGLVRGFRDEVEADGTFPVGIGFSTPQFTDGPDWVQRQANNMAGLEGFPLRPSLERSLGPNLAISYDSTAAAIAEHRFGRGRGVSRLLTMSIGTGISIGVVTETGPVDVNWGGTGDSGQIIVDPDATERCSCGGLGCLESVAAAPAIRRAALEAARDGHQTRLAEQLRKEGDIGVADVVLAGAEGDEVALGVLDRAGRFVGIALVTFIHMFRPELIVLCGGVARAGDLLLGPVRAAVDRHASPWYRSRLRGIEVSAFPLDGAAIGAATIILGVGRIGDRVGTSPMEI